MGFRVYQREGPKSLLCGFCSFLQFGGRCMGSSLIGNVRLGLVHRSAQKCGWAIQEPNLWFDLPCWRSDYLHPSPWNSPTGSMTWYHFLIWSTTTTPYPEEGQAGVSSFFEKSNLDAGEQQSCYVIHQVACVRFLPHQFGLLSFILFNHLSTTPRTGDRQQECGGPCERKDMELSGNKNFYI